MKVLISNKDVLNVFKLFDYVERLRQKYDLEYQIEFITFRKALWIDLMSFCGSPYGGIWIKDLENFDEKALEDAIRQIDEIIKRAKKYGEIWYRNKDEAVLVYLEKKHGYVHLLCNGASFGTWTENEFTDEDLDEALERVKGEFGDVKIEIEERKLHEGRI